MSILSVTELTSAIKKKLEGSFPIVIVQGEVSNCKVQSSGHCYFTLKDKESQIATILFHSNKLSKPLKEGDLVIIEGNVTVYAPRGSYQLIVKSLQYQGIGALLASIHELKAKLQAEGLFAKECKKKLPPFPNTIGVITSPTGAVIQDILQILQRRHKGFHLILYPVKVQGDGAAEEIAKAVTFFNIHHLADVLIIGRGGGSLEDLLPFHTEIVVRAVAASKIPTISAIGHETDVTLCDFAADVRAPTPSAAAELVLQEKTLQQRRCKELQARCDIALTSLIKRLRHTLFVTKKNPYFSSPYLLFSKKIQSVDDLRSKIESKMKTLIETRRLRLLALLQQRKQKDPSRQLELHRKKIQELQKNLTLSYTRLLLQKKERMQALSSHLHAINPKNLLTKGYCILFAENRDSVILSTETVMPSQCIHVLLQDGSLVATVESITHERASNLHF